MQVSGDSASCTGICTFSQALLEAGQEGAAARQDDAAIHDVRGQLGRGLVQGRLDGVEDLADRLVEGAADLLEVITIVLGRPVSMSRPRTSAWTSSLSSQAEPISSLSSSMVCCPIRSLYSF